MKLKVVPSCNDAVPAAESQPAPAAAKTAETDNFYLFLLERLDDEDFWTNGLTEALIAVRRRLLSGLFPDEQIELLSVYKFLIQLEALQDAVFELTAQQDSVMEDLRALVWDLSAEDRQSVCTQELVDALNRMVPERDRR